MEELKKAEERIEDRRQIREEAKKKQINFNREKSTTKISKTIADRKIT